MGYIRERQGKRTLNAAEAERTYWVFETLVEADAFLMAETTPEVVPVAIGTRTKRIIESVEEIDGLDIPNAWEVTVSWEDPAASPNTFGGSPLGYEVSYSIGGTTEKILLGTGPATRYPSDAPDFGYLIGVTDNSVEGVDVYVPSLERQETHTMTAAEFLGLQPTLYSLAGKTNSGSFRGTFAAGEVLFIGGEGSTNGDESKLVLKFSCKPHKQNVNLGGITVSSKPAHDYLWARYIDKTVSDEDIKVPSAAYVSPTTTSASFAGLPS